MAILQAPGLKQQEESYIKNYREKLCFFDQGLSLLSLGISAELNTWAGLGHKVGSAGLKMES